MRKIVEFACLTAATVAMMGMAVAAEPAKPAEKAASADTKGAAKYSTDETDMGTILDDPVAKAIVEKHIPGMTTSDQIDMARGMTLKAIQTYAADTVTDEKLKAIDEEFAKLPK